MNLNAAEIRDQTSKSGKNDKYDENSFTD